MQFQTMVGIYQVSISPDAERAAFEEIMRTQVFPKVKVGNQTRGGVVTCQSLLKNEASDSEYDYAWVVRWENQGGSPFGARNAPPDPAPQLTEFAAKTSFTRYALIDEETQ